MTEQTVEVPGTIAVDGAVDVVVAADDMRAVEEMLQGLLVLQAKHVLGTLVETLASHSSSAPRALHLIAETAKTYQKMLTALAMPGTAKPQRRSGLGSYVVATPEGEGEIVDAGMLQSEMSPGGETFAGQALQQILALAKNHILPKPDKPTLDAEAILSRPVPRVDNSFAIESLTRALATAKAAGLSDQIAEKLQKRLEEAIEAHEKLVLVPEGPGTSKGPSDEERTALGASFLGGVAAGIAGGE